MFWWLISFYMIKKLSFVAGLAFIVLALIFINKNFAGQFVAYTSSPSPIDIVATIYASYATTTAVSNTATSSITVPYNATTTISWNVPGLDSCVITKNGVQVATSSLSTKVYVTDSSGNRVEVFDTSSPLITQYLSQFGSLGSSTGQFNRPLGIALDLQGNIYVVDSNNNRIEKFSFFGKYLSQFGTSGSGNGQFNKPVGITIDSSGHIYVADTENNRVQKFNASGAYLSQFGTSGSGNGQFSIPHGVALDLFGNIYVADTGNNRIQKFDANGNYMFQWGTYTFNSTVGLYSPWAITSTGNSIYLSDTGNNRIEGFNGGDGATLGIFGSFGSGNGEFNQPAGSAFSSNGQTFYLADLGNNRIQRFNWAGGYETQWGTQGSGNGQFTYPFGVATFESASGNLNSGPITATTTFTATCGTATQTVTVYPTGSAGTTLVLSAASSTIGQYSSTTIYYASTNANSCTVYKNGIQFATSSTSVGNIAINQNLNTGLLSTTTTFSITCTGPMGTTTQSKIINVLSAPLCRIGLNYPPTTVTWTASNATSYTVTKDNIFFASGISGKVSTSTGPMTSNTVFKITCTGPGGTTSSVATSTVPVSTGTTTPKITGSISATPVVLSCTGGATSTLSWTTNAPIVETVIQIGTNSARFYCGIGGSVSRTIPVSSVPITFRIYPISDCGPSGVRGLLLASTTVSVTKSTSTCPISCTAPAPLMKISAFATSTSWSANGATSCTVTKNGNQIASSTPGDYVYVVKTNLTSYGIVKYDQNLALLNDLNTKNYSRISSNPNGNVYALNRCTISQFSPAGTLISSFGSCGTAPGQLSDINIVSSYVHNLTTDSLGNVYVLDYVRGQIIKFKSDGTFIFQFGSVGSGNGQISSSTDLAVDASGNIYVADSGNNRIQKFSPSGVFLLQFGTSGTGDKQFNNPYAISLDSFGNIYVADQGNNRIQKFDKNGNFIMKFGTIGTLQSQFSRIRAVDTDSNGNIFVMDEGRVQKFDSIGKFILQFRDPRMPDLTIDKSIHGVTDIGSITATTTLTLSCKNACGNTFSTSTVVYPKTLFTIDIHAASTSIPYGATTTVFWSSTNASSCDVIKGRRIRNTTSGSLSTEELLTSQTYTLTCTGIDGTVLSKSITIAPLRAPISIDFSASTTTVNYNGSVNFFWKSNNANSCLVYVNDVFVTKGIAPYYNNELGVSFLSTTTTYSITCTNEYGDSLTKKIPITVIPYNSTTIVAAVLIDDRLYKLIKPQLDKYINYARIQRGFGILIDSYNGMDDLSFVQIKDRISNLRSNNPSFEGVLFVGNIKIPSGEFCDSVENDVGNLTDYYEDYTSIFSRSLNCTSDKYDFDTISYNHPDIWTAWLPVGKDNEDPHDYAGFASQLSPYLQKVINFYEKKIIPEKKVYQLSMAYFWNEFPIWDIYGPNNVDYYSISPDPIGTPAVGTPPEEHLCMNGARTSADCYVRFPLENYPTPKAARDYSITKNWMGFGWFDKNIFINHMASHDYEFVNIFVHGAIQSDQLLWVGDAKTVKRGGIVLIHDGCDVAKYSQLKSDDDLHNLHADNNSLLGYLYGTSDFITAIGNGVLSNPTPQFDKIVSYEKSAPYLGRSFLDAKRNGMDPWRTLLGDPFLKI